MVQVCGGSSPATRETCKARDWGSLSRRIVGATLYCRVAPSRRRAGTLAQAAGFGEQVQQPNLAKPVEWRVRLEPLENVADRGRVRLTVFEEVLPDVVPGRPSVSSCRAWTCHRSSALPSAAGKAQRSAPTFADLRLRPTPPFSSAPETQSSRCNTVTGGMIYRFPAVSCVSQKVGHRSDAAERED